MTPNENKSIVQAFYDQWNSGAIDFDRLVDEDVTNHQPDRDPERGLDRFRQGSRASSVLCLTPSGRLSS